jgi:RNA polymerase sigma factor (sigma-70 family)
MECDAKQDRFAREVLPHLDAAYRLALRLVRTRHDAEDLAQEAMLRAFKYLDGSRGDNAKAWLLSIVRNACYDWIKMQPKTESIDAESPDDIKPEHESALAAAGHGVPAPDAELIARADRRRLQQALDGLPIEYREILVLRELEELSYKEIAAITAIPIGTVMSRLSRARALLMQACSRPPTPVVSLSPYRWRASR